MCMSNQWKMFPHTHNSFYCAVMYRMVFNMNYYLMEELLRKQICYTIYHKQKNCMWRKDSILWIYSDSMDRHHGGNEILLTKTGATFTDWT